LAYINEKEENMREMIKLMIGFAPWIAFMIIAGHSLFRLEVGLIVAAALTVLMSFLKIHRGSIVLAGYFFFGVALIMVLGLKNMWFIQHIGLLANGTLLFFTIFGMLIGKPFTEEYAKDGLSEEACRSGEFVRKVYISTTLWLLIFLLNFCLEDIAQTFPEVPKYVFKIINYAILLGGVVATRMMTYIWRRNK